MIENFFHFLFFDHRWATLSASVAFYLLVILAINAGTIARAARRVAGARA